MQRSIKSIKKALARKRKQLVIFAQEQWNPDYKEYEKEISALEIELMNRKNRR